MTLDDYFAVRPGVRVALIKCDVEGHELRVFQGGERVLREHQPALLFECEARHRGGAPVEDVFRWLEARGYRGSFFLGGERRGVESFTADLQRDPHRRPYVNNFVFTPQR